MPESEIVTLPLLPLRESVLVPGMSMPIGVGRPRSVRAIEQAVNETTQIVLAPQRVPEQEEIAADASELLEIGVLARVGSAVVEDGFLRVLVTATARVRLRDVREQDGMLVADVEPFGAWDWLPTPEALDARRALRKALGEIIERGFSSGFSADSIVNGMEDPDALVVAALSAIPVEFADRCRILAASDHVEAMRITTEVLSGMAERLEVQQKIAHDVREEVNKNQREFILREQMKAIQKELGEEDPGQAEVDALRAKVAESAMPDEVRAKANKELDRMSRLPGISPEVGVLRNYIDWLLDLPWGVTSPDAVALADSERILDEDHYGLERVKERIVEFLAVRKLSDSVRSPILCFAGPPGVGKTSLGKSIARAMGREFVRMSLGGLHDEAEIRGHRRTYIGAMPGRIISGMKQAKSANPVFMLDEIDKLGHDFRGDPASALLEVLDPEQNATFTDNYLEVPFDLSGVLFIATANSLDGIPEPLRDRMEIITIAGYTEREKLEIARRYLVAKQAEAHGLAERGFTVPDEALLETIRRYTKEAGVRSLEREVATLARKKARALADDPEASPAITPADLDPMLGSPRFDYGVLDLDGRPGAATGLVVTNTGGDVITIETSLAPGGRSLTLTGQLGEVMRESAQTALSWIEAHAPELGIAPERFEGKLHVHVPAGAIPKDGPSAGITLATAIVSLLTGIAVRPDVAMTGEITLRGRVLPIGGLKSKVLAAHLSGARTVLYPAKNAPDLREIPDEVKEGLELVAVERIEEVLTRALVAPLVPLAPSIPALPVTPSPTLAA